ncbi:hypothetical protein [Methanimicrococcus blatticola]|uniref:Uncharacterized protein n=1 Tax=Methanimicrococcus blatticola TaxID=91560 RepID=A0A484F782_9EURY|nr:hypothetical protein [Methanimicrococcus blatticola]MBZ3935146.1 hypothetical protein [Methanimicrococcus blatticola]MCC2508757.1 hypothetical protein [Methanimicrococcus blatticola]TDQ71208.1 hypothetical protein C7391_0313 [Methanimicrococcus blatticola]
MKDILVDVRRNLLEKDFIQVDLLTWGMKKEASLSIHRENVFFGMKGEEFMILPFVDFNTILYDQVKYYKKGEIEIKFSSFFGIFKVTFKDGSKKYTLPAGREDIKKIISMFYG